jgi:hypothetical protein
MIPDDWIPVDKELPPQKLYVLVWNNNNNVAAIVRYKGTHWSSSAVSIKLIHVTHWMHIVPPPNVVLKVHDWKFKFTKQESQDNKIGKIN